MDDTTRRDPPPLASEASDSPSTPSLSRSREPDRLLLDPPSRSHGSELASAPLRMAAPSEDVLAVAYTPGAGMNFRHLAGARQTASPTAFE